MGCTPGTGRPLRATGNQPVKNPIWAERTTVRLDGHHVGDVVYVAGGGAEAGLVFRELLVRVDPADLGHRDIGPLWGERHASLRGPPQAGLPRHADHRRLLL